MGRRTPVHKAAGVTGDVGAGAPGQPGLDAGLLDTVARPVLGSAGGRLGLATTRSHVQRGRERQLHTPGPPLQGERRRRRDVECDGRIHATARRHQHHGSSTVPPRLRGPTNMSGPGGTTGRTRTRLLQSTRSDTGSPATPSPGALRRLMRARVTARPGPRTPMSSAPKTRSPSSCTQPEPSVVGDDPPQQHDQHLATIGPRGRAGRAQRLTAWGRESFREGPGPPPPSGRRPRLPQP